MDVSLDILEERRTSLALYLSVDELKRLFEDGESLVYRLIVDDDRGLDADSLGTIEGTTDEDSSLEEFGCDLVADLLGCEVLSDEESLSGDGFVDFWIFCDECLESYHHIVSLFLCLAREIVSEYHLDTCDSCRTGKRTSTCCRRMDKRIRIHHTLPYLLSRTECTHRHDTTTERLPECDDIWNYSPVVDTEHLPSTSESSLYLVCDEECTVFASHLSDCWPVVIWWYDRTCLTLNRLYDDTGNSDTELLTGLELRTHSLRIPILDEVDRSTVHLANRVTVECLAHHRE